MFLAHCRTCGATFCDRCEEAAAKLEQTVSLDSGGVMMFVPVCANCRSTEVDHDGE
jgi:hypothetical protein